MCVRVMPCCAVMHCEERFEKTLVFACFKENTFYLSCFPVVRFGEAAWYVRILGKVIFLSNQGAC